MGWKVFLPDRYFKPAEQKIHEIAGSLKDSVPVEGGLLDGKVGLALFFSYYARWIRDQSYQEDVAEWIEQGLNTAASQFTGFSLSNGLGGVGWMIQCIVSNGLIEMDADSVFKEMDELLYHHMMQEIRSGHYDYLHGALGITLYFLRETGNSKYRSYLDELVNELDKVAEKEPDGSVKWLSVLDHDTGKRGYNLSLSHGQASIIIILSKLLRNGISRHITEKLLRSALQYLDNQKLPPGQYMSLYPSWALESTEVPDNSRLAWCYGDIGIGLSYRYAGRILSNRSMELNGDMILLHTAQRRDPVENMVYDAGICHGASGIALVFNILYQETGLIQYREAAVYWLDVCLNMSHHRDGIAGYKAWHLPEYGGWKNTPGLLNGVAGIGLSLLSFVSDQEPSWVGSLLLI